jgi:hypothetical protein
VRGLVKQSANALGAAFLVALQRGEDREERSGLAQTLPNLVLVFVARCRSWNVSHCWNGSNRVEVDPQTKQYEASHVFQRHTGAS